MEIIIINVSFRHKISSVNIFSTQTPCLLGLGKSTPVSLRVFWWKRSWLGIFSHGYINKTVFCTAAKVNVKLPSLNSPARTSCSPAYSSGVTKFRLVIQSKSNIPWKDDACHDWVRVLCHYSGNSSWEKEKYQVIKEKKKKFK